MLTKGSLLGAFSIPLGVLSPGETHVTWRPLGRANGHVLFEATLARAESDL